MNRGAASSGRGGTLRQELASSFEVNRDWLRRLRSSDVTSHAGAVCPLPPAQARSRCRRAQAGPSEAVVIHREHCHGPLSVERTEPNDSWDVLALCSDGCRRRTIIDLKEVAGRTHQQIKRALAFSPALTVSSGPPKLLTNSWQLIRCHAESTDRITKPQQQHTDGATVLSPAT
jgi:hypothetical protein